MKFEIDEKKIESICYKGKYGKKFIIFLEDGAVTDIIDTGVGTPVEEINAEREEILTALKELNGVSTNITTTDDKITTQYC